MVGAQWDLANKNERGNQQHNIGGIKGHNINTYVTACASCYCALRPSEHGRIEPIIIWVRAY